MAATAITVGLCFSSLQAAPPRIWPVDALVKVFPDSQPADAAVVPVPVARGEHASLQFAVRSEQAISGLRAGAGELRPQDGAVTPLKPQPARFVGYVPVERPTQTPSKDRLRIPPAEFPDPLLEVDALDVPAGRTQPIWITVPIPKQASPGRYHGTLTVAGRVGPDAFELTQPYDVRIHKVTVERTRLWITNWSPMCWGAPPAAEDTARWETLRQQARMMAEHRQNVMLISPMSFCQMGIGSDGGLTFDWSSFDRAVELFIAEGVIGRIEGAHLGGRSGAWESQFVAQVHRVKDGKVESLSLPPNDPEVEKFLGRYLPALVAHLNEKGWVERYMQHIGDEPTDVNVAAYKAIAQIVRKHAPQLRIIDAIHSKEAMSCNDIAVPMLNYLHSEYTTYREHPRDGRELWFYTCCQPQGEYANRFMEQPLIKTRLLHWINFRYHLTGYLHWGYNFYLPGDPFKNTTASAPAKDYWPAGDPYIVYPGPGGRPLSSIRFEAMRDGIVDHELLSMLAERDPSAAEGMAARHVLDFDKYETDLAAFRATRRELLRLLEK